jgi:hypothetical protein
MKHLKYTLETCVYSHINICNIETYFCNIQIKHLQHKSETSETLETRLKYAYRVITNIWNIQIKHLKYMFETSETLKT